MTTVASFVGGGPLAGTQRTLEEVPDFIKSGKVEPPAHPSPDSPSSWPHILYHVYELDAVRLVLGDEARVFYHYIGIAHDGDLI